jgi:hypothetical protein
VRKVETGKHELNKNPQIQKQKIASTQRNKDETREEKSEICSIKTEHDSHTITEVIVIPLLFDWK